MIFVCCSVNIYLKIAPVVVLDWIFLHIPHEYISALSSGVGDFDGVQSIDAIEEFVVDFRLQLRPDVSDEDQQGGVIVRVLFVVRMGHVGFSG